MVYLLTLLKEMKMLNEARAKISGYKTYGAALLTGIYAIGAWLVFGQPVNFDLIAVAVLSSTLRAAIAKGPTPPPLTVVNGELIHYEGRSARRGTYTDAL